MLNYLVLDTETTIFQKGHPFAERNRLCVVGYKTATTKGVIDVEYTLHPYKKELDAIQALVDSCDVIVLFNGKFDLHWFRRYGIRFEHKMVWDCQLVEFILGNQLNRFPSLNQAAQRLVLPTKLDVISTHYWDNGIDTPDIPSNILWEYVEWDCYLTEQVYLKQLAEVEAAGKMPLVKLHNADLLVLEEMEANGIKFDLPEMESRRAKIQEKLSDVESKLGAYSGGWGHFNWTSPDHLSCLLYGGTINVDVAEPYEHTYKGGAKAGTTQTRNRWTVVSRTYTRLAEPIKGSELKKEGYWSTDEGTLKQLKGVSKLVDLLLLKAEYVKLLSTYYEGIPKLIPEMDWYDGCIHGQLNQCVVVTGRLSASKPNQQNFVAEVQECIVSRFPSSSGA